MNEAMWKSIALRQSSLPVLQAPAPRPLPLAGKPMDLDEIFEQYANEQKG